MVTEVVHVRLACDIDLDVVIVVVHPLRHSKGVMDVDVTPLRMALCRPSEVIGAVALRGDVIESDQAGIGRLVKSNNDGTAYRLRHIRHHLTATGG